MNEKSFTRKLLFLVVCIVVTAGCSNYKDEQSIPPATLPESVIKVLSDAFPNATDATFQTVEKDKLYEVHYKLNGDPFYAALNTKKILSVYRTYASVPDSMRTALPVNHAQAGELDNYREPVNQSDMEHIYLAKYTWNNAPYLLTWTRMLPTDAVKYSIRLEPYVKFSYSIFKDEMASLPTLVGSFLEREKLRFSSARISINEENKKEYLVYASTPSSTNYQFTFDDSGKLINTIYRAEAFYYNLDELPEKIQTFMESSAAISTMQIVEGYKFSDPVGTGYVINMKGKEEECWINFDQDGNYVNLTYATTLYR